MPRHVVALQDIDKANGDNNVNDISITDPPTSRGPTDVDKPAATEKWPGGDREGR